ncbi:hypothetical protein ACMGG8_17405 [Pseudomonas sp. BNK-45]|uniref:hypothetical protein n=1 Tax=Pseudomonas sp. BNK-45 TaxID=3376180 RepID=UPI0039BF410C
MRKRTTANRDLPPRMVRCIKKGKKGQIWTAYYYDGRHAAGKRKEIAQGTDLDQAKVEWARLERKAPPQPNHLMSYVFHRYEKEIISGKSIAPSRTTGAV